MLSYCRKGDAVSDGEELQPGPALVKQDGVTGAERYLKQLCDRTFLSLWSYPGVYRDQGQTAGSREGKEVCDLLVVFGNHVIIFSDKDCKFPDSGDLRLDWCRWFRRAVMKSAEQVWGAERWIRSHPDRLFLDRRCSRPFPIDVPNPAGARFHRIVVAHDASRRCRDLLGGSGSLIIDPGIVGAHHCEGDDVRPFRVGQIDPRRGFVHVLDDTSLDVLLRTLDTISDFVNYLARKEAFIQSGRLAFAAGEDDLLAFYLKYLNDQGEQDFVVPDGVDGVLIDEGLWEEFEAHPQRLAQVRANEVSYAWDELIEKFNHHILAGTWYDRFKATARDREKAVRMLAAECRTARRGLAQSLLGLVAASFADGRQLRRVMLPMRPGGPFYAFLLLPHPPFAPEEEYREVRGKLLEALCMVVRLKYPEAQDIVELATEAGDVRRRSEDVLYLDGRTWSDEMQAEAESLRRDLGLLTNPTGPFHVRVQEYPDVPPSPGQPVARIIHDHQTIRSFPCPCGSGKAGVKCCLR
jgi:hypothetical protein